MTITFPKKIDRTTACIIAFIIVELAIERVFRVFAGQVWFALKLPKNIFGDDYAGEGCFLASVLITTALVSYFFKASNANVYRGPVLLILVDVFAGAILGLFQTMGQALALHHFHYYVSYVDLPTPQFPGAKEAISCLLVAITEELAFRAFLYPVISRTWGTATALVATSALFAVAHLTNANALSNLTNILATLGVTFTAGFVFGLLLLLTGRIWLPIAFHFATDFFFAVLYGDPSVAVSPLWKSFDVPDKINQFSLVINVAISIVLLTMTIRQGKWKKFTVPSSSQLP